MDYMYNYNEAQLETVSITDELFARFIKYIDASSKTVETYTRAIRQFAKYLAERNITRPERSDILAYREELKERNYKPTTIQAYITAVRKFFQWTESERIYPNIADHVKGARIDREPKKDYLTTSQLQAVMHKASEDKSVQGLRNYAVLALLFTGGLRTIEISRADIKDIRTAGNDTVLYVQGKGHDEKADYMALVPEAEEAVKAYLNARNANSSEEPLFISTSNRSKDKRLSTRSISSIVKNALLAVGLNSDRLTAHSTRHTAVTQILISGATLQEAQEFARHKDISTTNIYAHNLNKAETKRKCAGMMGKLVFG